MEPETPNYVIKTSEACPVPVKKPLYVHLLMILLGLVMLCFSLTSLLARERVSTPFTVLCVLLITGLTVVVLYLSRKREIWKPFPLEVRFYESYMEVDRGCHYYGPGSRRRILDRIVYEDLVDCVCKQKSRIFLYGSMHTTWFPVGKNGVSGEKPMFDKFLPEAVVELDTRFEQTVDLPEAIAYWSRRPFKYYPG